MTFNLRFENDSDGPNAWSFRRGLVTGLIEKHAPYIIGTQEGMMTQLIHIRDSLPFYDLHAPQRTPDVTCQYPTLFFRKDTFRVLEGGEFWLSKTPNVHRSKSWDSAFPRMMSYARLSNNADNEFWVAVTHLDHIGEQARYQQAKMIAEWIKTRTGPVILMGDFNDSPGSAVHALLTSSETGLHDTWEVIGHKENIDSFTQHRFTGIPQKTRMDWILVSANFRVIEVDIIRDHLGDRYPSDHFPVLARLMLS